MVAYYEESNIKLLTLARVLLVILALAMLSVGVFAVLVVSWVALSTGGAAASADEFLAALNDGDGPRAYSMVSSSMLRVQKQQRFDLQLASLGPARFQLRSLWRRTLPEAGAVVLTGTMQMESGRLAPFAISMAKEDGWKVFSVTNRFDIDVGPGVWFRGMPAESEVRRFLETTLLDLNEAALARDYSLFLDKIPGTEWVQIRNSPITGSFDRLAEEVMDYAGIAGMDAVFDRPPGWHIVSACGAFGGGCANVGEGTTWIAAGRYPLKQFSVSFQLIYTYQHPDWVLDCAFGRECFVTVGPER